MPEVQDPLRLVPGLQVTQTGQMGGTTGLSIRGGSTDANKVLIDGVPANAIGGGVEFANIATVGIDSIEVLREPNSALYGSDALAGVVSMRSARGTTPSALHLLRRRRQLPHLPQRSHRRHGLSSVRSLLRLRPHRHRNNIPNSEFHNATYAGNFGWTPNSTNDLRFTVRHIIVSGGQPNAIAFLRHPRRRPAEGTGRLLQRRLEQPDHATLAQPDSLRRPAPERPVQRPRRRWHPRRFRRHRWRAVTITGANGYSVHGQALFYTPGSPGPLSYLGNHQPRLSSMPRPTSTSALTCSLSAPSNTKTKAASTDTPAILPPPFQRGNYSYTIQISGDVSNRLFYNLGTGLEDNGLFGFAATPRASLAYYLFRPSAQRLLQRNQAAWQLRQRHQGAQHLPAGRFPLRNARRTAERQSAHRPISRRPAWRRGLPHLRRWPRPAASQRTRSPRHHLLP
jgi:vitamin B12 transporter